MKHPKLLLLAAFALTLTGCSTPTNVDTGPIHASTFNFFQNGTMPSAEFVEKDAKIHAMFQNAITTRLAQSGVNRVNNGPGDLTVAYLLLIANNSSVTSVNDYFGYGRDALALADQAQKKYAMGDDSPNAFVAGTLIIDLVDSNTHKLLKRSSVVRPIQGNVSDEVRAARIQDAVNEALKDLKLAK